MNREAFDIKLIELLKNPEISKEQLELLQMIQKSLSYIDDYRALISYYSFRETDVNSKEKIKEFESILEGTEAEILKVSLKEMSDKEVMANKKQVNYLMLGVSDNEEDFSSVFNDALKNKENRINALEEEFQKIQKNNNISPLYAQASRAYNAIKAIQSSERTELFFDLNLIKHADYLESKINKIKETTSMISEINRYTLSISKNIELLANNKKSKEAKKIQSSLDEIKKEEVETRLSLMKRLYNYAISEASVVHGILDKKKAEYQSEYEIEREQVNRYLKVLENAGVTKLKEIKEVVGKTTKDVENKIKKNGVLADYEEAFKTLNDLHIKMKDKFEKHLLGKSIKGQEELEVKEEKSRKEQEEFEKKQQKEMHEKDLFISFVEMRFGLIQEDMSKLFSDLKFIETEKASFLDLIKTEPSFVEATYKDKLKEIEANLKSTAKDQIQKDLNDKRNKVNTEIVSLENRLKGLEEGKIASDIAALKEDPFITRSSFKVKGIEGLIDFKETIESDYNYFMEKLNKIEQDISYHEKVIIAINKAKSRNDFLDFFEIILNKDESLKNIINDYMDEAFKKNLLGSCRSPALIGDDRFEAIKKQGIFDKKTIDMTQKIRDIKHAVDCRNLTDQNLIDIINFQMENNISISNDKLSDYLDKYHNDPENLQKLKEISKTIIDDSPQIIFQDAHIKNLNKMIFENDDLQVVLKKMHAHKDAKMEAWMVVLLNENKDFCHQLKEHFENDKSDGALIIEIMRSFFSLPLEDANKKTKNQLAAEQILSGVYDNVSTKGKDPRDVLKKLLSKSHGKFSWERLFSTLEDVERLKLDKKIINNTHLLIKELNKRFRDSGMASDADIKRYRKRAINLVLTHTAQQKTLKETEEGLMGLSEDHFAYGSSKAGTLKTLLMDAFRLVDNVLKKLSLPPINFFSKLKTQSAVKQEIKEIFNNLPSNNKK